MVESRKVGPRVPGTGAPSPTAGEKTPAKSVIARDTPPEPPLQDQNADRVDREARSNRELQQAERAASGTRAEAHSRSEAQASGQGRRALESPGLGKSTQMVSLLLAADKGAFIDRGAKNLREALEDRALAKRIGLILQTTPYGAPNAVILKRVQDDPIVGERMKSATMRDLFVLHERFPEVVPRPSVPVDIGSSLSPTIDGYADVYTSHFATAEGRASMLAAAFGSIGGPTRHFETRYSRMEGLGLRPEDFPDINLVIEKAQKLSGEVGRLGLFLRRTISNAPPHWGAKEIAEEHNRYVEYYGPLLYRGTGDTLEAAKARATVTPEEVQKLMAEHPVATGAADLAERQRAFRGLVAAELETAKAGENLYEVLSRVVDKLEATPRRKPELTQRPGFLDLRIFDPPPSVSAAITADDVLASITRDPSFAGQLDRLLGERNARFDKLLAERIAKTFGSRLGAFNVEAIAEVMHKKDPVYNADLVRYLMSSFPKILGAEKADRARVEMDFLLANKVADAMERMFPGATLDDVASFLRREDPAFDRAYPDFSGEDVRLLQQANPFLPQWEDKPTGADLHTRTKMPLKELMGFATLQLGAKEAGSLQAKVLTALGNDLEGETVPPELVKAIDLSYRKALLSLVAKSFAPPERAAASASVPKREVYEGFVYAYPDAPKLDHGALLKILTDRDMGLELSKERASHVASALLHANALDFGALESAMHELLTGKPNADVEIMRLSNLALGYSGLLTRLERDIFMNRDLKASFRRFARIPLRLPMIQSVVDKYKDRQPLKDANVLMVQHMLGQAYPQMAGYKQLGMDPKKCIFVGIPYHKNEEVEEAVARSFGVDVRVPPRDMDELYRAIEKGVDDTITRHLENGKPCLIVCDGPHARDYFKAKWLKEHPELASKVRFTEQTAFGDRPEYRNDRSMRVVSYARTDLKAKKEAKFIGQAVARAVTAVLTQMGTGHEEKPILILGYGPIGTATAEAFSGDRSKIYVYDPYMTDAMRKDAESKGFVVLDDKTQIAKGKFLLIGCSGHQSIDEEQILASDPNAIYVSASSKLVEIDIRKLRELATDGEGRLRRVLAAEVNDQQTWHYWLKDGTIRTVVADGLPANFNDINSVPPEFIDMTMALGIAAAAETMSDDALGYHSLNEGDSKELYELHERLVDAIHREAKRAAEVEDKVARVL